MKPQAVTKLRFARVVVGAGLAVLGGLALWWGKAWENPSYDHLFRFGALPVTNKVVLVLMDNLAFAQLGQARTQIWSRALHTKLLNKLAGDECPLVVFDVLFEESGDPAEDQALAKAMQRQRKVVLVAEQESVSFPIIEGVSSARLTEPFRSVAGPNCGVAKVDTNFIVRQHWPFLSPGPQPSLPWTAAQLAGAELSNEPQERWLRYYGDYRRYDGRYHWEETAWTNLSYEDALTQPTNYFRDKIVFIGRDPETPWPDGEDDEFRTFYTSRTGESAAGVKIIATEFLNLVNGDWLRRPPSWIEALVLVITGVLLGGGLGQLRLWVACILAAATFLAVMLGAVSLSYFSNYWFPWLVVAGGQVPLALSWSIVAAQIRPKPEAPVETIVIPQEVEPPDYERFGPPFGVGGFGKVWVVRNSIDEWLALKEVYKANFGDDVGKFEIEFNGIQNYKPISHKHPGLLRIEFVSREKVAGFFYYVMELGDALEPEVDWKQNPTSYKPRDLKNACARAERNRLPVRECVEIGFKLADALEFLHAEGLTHRDIKPGNVIFVKGQPKLADAGTVTVLRPPEQIHTRLYSRGYTPPNEPAGTKQADIYSLGKLLYTISTGRNPEDDFPTLSTTLLERTGQEDFMGLNNIIVKACRPNLAERYASAREMQADLRTVLDGL